MAKLSLDSVDKLRNTLRDQPGSTQASEIPKVLRQWLTEPGLQMDQNTRDLILDTLKTMTQQEPLATRGLQPSPNRLREGAELNHPTLRRIAVAIPPPESKQDVRGDFTWTTSHGDAYRLEDMTITLFRAVNDSGNYKSYLTFSAFATSLGRSTDHALPPNHYPNEGLYFYAKLNSAQGGVLLQWDIPPVDIQCAARRAPVFIQKDNVDPDIYPLVESCTFGQARDNAGDKC